METTLTIRKLDPLVKRRLRIQAAAHGRSMEAEVRVILAREVQYVTDMPLGVVDEERVRMISAREAPGHEG